MPADLQGEYGRQRADDGALGDLLRDTTQHPRGQNGNRQERWDHQDQEGRRRHDVGAGRLVRDEKFGTARECIEDGLSDDQRTDASEPEPRRCGCGWCVSRVLPDLRPRKNRRNPRTCATQAARPGAEPQRRHRPNPAPDRPPEYCQRRGPHGDPPRIADRDAQRPNQQTAAARTRHLYRCPTAEQRHDVDERDEGGAGPGAFVLGCSHPKWDFILKDSSKSFIILRSQDVVLVAAQSIARGRA